MYSIPSPFSTALSFIAPATTESQNAIYWIDWLLFRLLFNNHCQFWFLLSSQINLEKAFTSWKVHKIEDSFITWLIKDGFLVVANKFGFKRQENGFHRSVCWSRFWKSIKTNLTRYIYILRHHLNMNKIYKSYHSIPSYKYIFFFIHSLSLLLSRWTHEKQIIFSSSFYNP